MTEYTPKGYTDQDDIEAFLGVSLDESENIDQAIATAEKIIDHETNRDFSVAAEDATAEERTFNGTGTSKLYTGPLKDVEAVTLYVGGEPIAAEQYVVGKDSITLRYLKFPEGVENITVEAIWGLEEVPPDINLAASMLAAGILQNTIPTTEEVSNYTVGRYSVTYKTKGPQAGAAARVQDILDFNKRYHF